MITVDPALPENHNRDLWLVYGVECMPTILCCRIEGLLHNEPIIWGYSVYRGEPGFRTLGRNVLDWMKALEEKYGWSLWEFYLNQDQAFLRLRELTTPEPNRDYFP